MASTSNRNTPGNYCMEQWTNNKQSAYSTYEPYGVASPQLLAGDGLIIGHMGRETMSYNSEDIESYLFGIGSTNLVKPKAPVQPHFKTLESLSIINRLPLIMPKPLEVQNDQRQYPMQ
jgi:hypothetical protein